MCWHIHWQICRRHAWQDRSADQQCKALQAKIKKCFFFFFNVNLSFKMATFGEKRWSCEGERTFEVCVICGIFPGGNNEHQKHSLHSEVYQCPGKPVKFFYHCTNPGGMRTPGGPSLMDPDSIHHSTTGRDLLSSHTKLHTKTNDGNLDN